MKQERTRYLIKQVEYEVFLNRMADGLTSNMFAALWFHKQEEAEHWLQEGRYAPKEPGYEIVETLTTIQEVSEDDGLQTDLHARLDRRTKVAHENG